MTRRLPALLEEIAGVAGVQAAYQMAQARGGQKVYIPARLDDSHWLVKACGAEAARKIANHFAADGKGIDLKIPVGTGSTYLKERAARARVMQEAIDAGLSNNEIVARVGLDRSSVFRAKQKLKSGSGDQGDLF